MTGFLLRPYDVTKYFQSAPCSFVYYIPTEFCAWCDFSLLMGSVFCSFSWLNFCSDMTHIIIKNKCLPCSEIDFSIYFNSKRKGHVSACHSNWRVFEGIWLKQQKAKQNITFQHMIKIIFFCYVFFHVTFLRIQIYKAIAASFWKSASYGWKLRIE